VKVLDFGLAKAPDGRWVAFDSPSTEKYQIAVVALSGAGGRVIVTSNGGRSAAWAPDGFELYFRREGAIRAVTVDSRPEGIHFGPERELFKWNTVREYAVGPRGEFYGVEPVPSAGLQTNIQLRTGWFSDIKRLTGK
jgi:hypothetical protein